jgi:predicted pyridoxine 5'-phosphate oxidase superfamily flavin-nucleotide-binding protein
MVISLDLKKLIEENVLSLSTVDKENHPHLICVMYAKVLDSNKVLITDNFMKETILNIQNNNSVALSFFVGEAGFEMKGTAKYFTNGPYLELVKNIYENKGLPSKGVILVNVSKLKRMG